MFWFLFYVLFMKLINLFFLEANYFTILYWFCHTLTWICHGYTWVPNPEPPPTTLSISYICCLQETHLKTRDTYRLKVKGWKKIFHANRDQKKAGVVILLSDKIDFEIKTVKRDKEGHYIMIKGSIQEEDIIIININIPNIGAPQYIRQMLTSMKGEINSNTIILGTLIPHSHLGIDQTNRKLARKHRL